MPSAASLSAVAVVPSNDNLRSCARSVALSARLGAPSCVTCAIATCSFLGRPRRRRRSTRVSDVVIILAARIAARWTPCYVYAARVEALHTGRGTARSAILSSGCLAARRCMSAPNVWAIRREWLRGARSDTNPTHIPPSVVTHHAT
eukprot:COSAG01_NODE_13690_length_1547_cov_4.153315_1_plen_146_part_10